MVLSIRPHQIERAPIAPSIAPGAGALRGTVLRASYLGDAVDYPVRLEDSAVVLRVAAPASRRFRPGEAVTVTLRGGRPLTS